MDLNGQDLFYSVVFFIQIYKLSNVLRKLSYTCYCFALFCVYIQCVHMSINVNCIILVWFEIITSYNYIEANAVTCEVYNKTCMY